MGDMLTDFIATFENADQNQMFNDIGKLFIKTLKLKKVSYSIAIYWNDEDKNILTIPYYQSPSVEQGAFASTIEAVRKLLENSYVNTPKTFNHAEITCSALVIPVMYAYITYGYVVVFFHDKILHYESNSPQAKRLHKAMYLAALSHKERLNMEKLGFHLSNDYLTELPNRAHIYEAIVHAIQTADPYEMDFALLAIRVNGLGHINNSLGMLTGDMMLHEVGNIIKDVISDLPHNSIVGRLNGGDFLIVITYPTERNNEEAREKNNKNIIAFYCDFILAKIKNCVIEINGYKLHPTVNVGASMYPQHGEIPETLLSKADLAKAHAKKHGLNNYIIYNKEMDSSSDKALFLINNLPDAIKENQFELFYQAIMDIATGEIIGAEALIRWRHPEKGLIFPGDFIEYAEENGYGIEIDKLVLEMACEQIKKWEDKNLTVSVNVSPKHLENGLVFDTVSKVLARKGVDPRRLKIELLESVLLKDFDVAVRVINALRDLGVCIALDDFGSGYSSLEYVAKLPLDFLKIDRSFTMNLNENPGNKTILETIMTLAKGMKVQTIAEGVETQYQLDFLKSIGCNLGQGYFINKPMPIKDFEALLSKNMGE